MKKPEGEETRSKCYKFIIRAQRREKNTAEALRNRRTIPRSKDPIFIQSAPESANRSFVIEAESRLVAASHRD